MMCGGEVFYTGKEEYCRLKVGGFFEVKTGLYMGRSCRDEDNNFNRNNTGSTKKRSRLVSVSGRYGG